MKKLLRSESGQALVEMAIVLPILLMLIMAILETGWLFSNKLMLDNVCREAARSAISAAAEGNNNEKSLARVESLLPTYAQGKVTAEISYSNETAFRKGDVQVRLRYQLKPITPLVGIFVPEDYNLQSSCTMKVS